MSRPSRRVRRERHPEDDNSSNHGNDYPSDSSLEEAGKIFSIKSNCRTNATNDDNTNNGGHVRRVEGEQRTGRGVLDGGRGATESARNGRRRRRGNVGDDATGCRAEDLKTYDPKSIGPDEYVRQMTTFMERFYLAVIHTSIVSAEDLEKDYALAVNAQDLIHFDPRLAYLVLHRPDLLLELMREALGLVQGRIVEESENDIQEGSSKHGTPRLTVKANAHARIVNLPPLSDLCKPNISSIRGNDLGALIQIQGTVIRTGAVKMLEVSREYRCQNKTCAAIFSVHSDMSQENLLAPPTSCPGLGEKQCKSTRFVEHGDHRYSDYQEVKVQEQAQKLSVGSIPRSMVILLQDDLVDSCKAGDDVVVVGELLRRWKPVSEGIRCDVQVTLRANSVTVQSGSDQGSSQVSEELRQEFVELWKANAHRPLAVRNHVVASVCPQIFGLFTVKLAILLTLIGGVTETDPRGMRRRGTPHLLVVGDPGCGKSQFLRFAAKLSPRSVLTTGVGTTSAGLTCSAVKDGGEWMLEAGALVLADRGLCCIDEFSAIREHDRATIHEAMEQQTLSVAKAGLVCKLNARTTVFAVTNTKGTYDMAEDMTVNTAIGSPLLSRFDLVLLLLDTKNKEWDKVVSTFVLRAAIGSGTPTNVAPKTTTAAQENAGGDGGVDHGRVNGTANAENASSRGQTRGRENAPAVSSKPWGTEKLQKYLCYVKDTFTSVRLSGDAEKVVARYYQSQRSADNRSAARTTVRLLESLIRLAQAHARLMCRTEVTLQDAVVSVICVETSLHSTAQLGMESVLHSDFPPNPDEEFEIQQGLILDRLGLSNLHRNRHPHPREPFPTQETNSGSQRGSSRQNGGTAGSNSNRHADGSRDWAASECVGRNPFSAGGDVDVDAAGSGPGRMSRGNNRGSLNGRSGMITDEERGWRSSARPDDDDIESDWSRTQRDSRPLSDVQSAGPDLSSVGGREGEERWTAFDGTPASGTKRRRSSGRHEGEEEMAGDEGGGGSGSGWGDVLLMSQRPSPPATRR